MARTTGFPPVPREPPTPCTSINGYPTNQGAAWIGKIRADGSDAAWMTFLGGGKEACEGGLTLDSYVEHNPGAIFACSSGGSNSDGLYFFAGAQGTGYQKTPAKTNWNTTALLHVGPNVRGMGWEGIDHSTYLGGTMLPSGFTTNGALVDWPQQIRLDSQGNVSVYGETAYTDFPGVSGGYISAYPSQVPGSSNGVFPTTMFLCKFPPTFATISQCTYVGGDGSEYVGGDGGMYIDSSDNIWWFDNTTSVSGYGYTKTLPVTTNQFDHRNGTAHAYGCRPQDGTAVYGYSAGIFEFAPSLQSESLLYGTCFGPNERGSAFLSNEIPPGLILRDVQWFPYTNGLYSEQKRGD